MVQVHFNLIGERATYLGYAWMARRDAERLLGLGCEAEAAQAETEAEAHFHRAARAGAPSSSLELSAVCSLDASEER